MSRIHREKKQRDKSSPGYLWLSLHTEKTWETSFTQSETQTNKCSLWSQLSHSFHGICRLRPVFLTGRSVVTFWISLTLIVSFLFSLLKQKKVDKNIKTMHFVACQPVYTTAYSMVEKRNFSSGSHFTLFYLVWMSISHHINITGLPWS